MFFQKKNQYGVISIDDALIKQIIENSVRDFNGKVILSNKKGQIFDSIKIFGVNDSNNYFDFKNENESYLVNVYIIVKFGMSLSLAANTIIKNLYSCMALDLGLNVENINVYITGIQTNKVLSKRSVIFSKFDNKNNPSADK